MAAQLLSKNFTPDNFVLESPGLMFNRKATSAETGVSTTTSGSSGLVHTNSHMKHVGAYKHGAGYYELSSSSKVKLLPPAITSNAKSGKKTIELYPGNRNLIATTPSPELIDRGVLELEEDYISFYWKEIAVVTFFTISLFFSFFVLCFPFFS